MIVAFCGHSKYIPSTDDEAKILKILEEKVKDEAVEFFLGEYGSFDSFAYECCKKFKRTHPKAKLVFITPYISDSYRKNRFEYQKDRFDLTVYPELENVPPKYAISHRNRWMVEQADFIVAYVKHEYGGAYTMYRYAKRKGKVAYNIAEEGISEKDEK